LASAGWRVMRLTGENRPASFEGRVPGAPGAVFAPGGDAEAWAGAVNGLLDDPARRESMITEGRTVAERYSWPLVAQRVLAVYRRVTG